jgi:PPOX class probable F420-dependent enzyme
MTEQEALAFLARGAPTGKLATAAADGSRVHVAPIWYLLEDGEIVFTTGEDTLKGRNLRANRNAALCVDDERPPFSYVEARGPVTVDPAAPDLVEWATRLSARYMGEQAGAAYGRRNGVPGELLVRLRIEHLRGVTAVAD